MAELLTPTISLLFDAHCTFCRKLDAGDYEGIRNGVAWFEPLDPVTPGHVLFVPVDHVEDACDNPPVTALVMQVAAQALTGCGDGNLIWNVGPLAGQTVWHAHLHWVPRREGDGLVLPWDGQERGGG